VLSPKKETKFRGMKSFIAYQLTPSVGSHAFLVDRMVASLLKKSRDMKIKLYHVMLIFCNILYSYQSFSKSVSSLTEKFEKGKKDE